MLRLRSAHTLGHEGCRPTSQPRQGQRKAWLLVLTPCACPCFPWQLTWGRLSSSMLRRLRRGRASNDAAANLLTEFSRPMPVHATRCSTVWGFALLPALGCRNAPHHCATTKVCCLAAKSRGTDQSVVATCEASWRTAFLKHVGSCQRTNPICSPYRFRSERR